MIGRTEESEYLADAAIAGDEEALGRLLAAHQPAAYAVALRLLGSEADAADAVQEAFLLAVRAVRGGDARPRHAAQFGAWFRRIVTNAALQRLRRQPRFSTISVDDLAEQLPARDSVEPGEEAERRELRGDVHRALLALPDAQRAALTLREFEDLSYEEIADALGTSRLAVQMLLFRARQNFRAAYEGIAAHDGTVGCAELAPLLSALLDSEVGRTGWLRLSVHLAHCRRCRTEIAELRRARRLAAAIPLAPLPAHWTWPAADGMIQAGVVSPAAPGLAEGVFQLSTIARAGAALATVGLGVTLVTSTPMTGGPRSDDGPGQEMVAGVRAAQNNQASSTAPTVDEISAIQVRAAESQATDSTDLGAFEHEMSVADKSILVEEPRGQAVADEYRPAAGGDGSSPPSERSPPARSDPSPTSSGPSSSRPGVGPRPSLLSAVLSDRASIEAGPLALGASIGESQTTLDATLPSSQSRLRPESAESASLLPSPQTLGEAVPSLPHAPAEAPTATLPAPAGEAVGAVLTAIPGPAAGPALAVNPGDGPASIAQPTIETPAAVASPAAVIPPAPPSPLQAIEDIQAAIPITGIPTSPTPQPSGTVTPPLPTAHLTAKPSVSPTVIVSPPVPLPTPPVSLPIKP